MTDDKKTYELYVLCTNCNFRGKIEVQKGILVNQISCPNCDNLTIKIDHNGEKFSRPHKPTSYR